MSAASKRVFSILPQDIVCEHKSIESLILPSSILHNHDGNEFLLLLNGTVEILTEGGGKLLKRGDLICVRTRDFHAVKILDDKVYDRIVVNMKDSVLQRLSTRRSDLANIFNQVKPHELNYVHLNESEIETYTRLADLLIESLAGDAFGDDVLADALLVQILVMVNRLTVDFHPEAYKNTVPDTVSAILTYVENNLTGDLSISTLEREFQYNGVYLSRCFKKVMGICLQQYIIAKRCSLAQQMLSQGSSPYDVCFLTGFHNYSNFARTFTRQTGHSPKQYQLMTAGGSKKYDFAIK